jgi:hypothetical protein
MVEGWLVAILATGGLVALGLGMGLRAPRQPPPSETGNQS